MPMRGFGGARFRGFGGHGYAPPAGYGRHHHEYLGPRLVEVAPVLAPAIGTLTVTNLSLDGNTLSATVTIDGQAYQGSLDLSELAQAVGDRVAAYHAQLHTLAQAGAQDPSVVAQTAPVAAQIAQQVSGEQKAAITLAGVSLVNQLADRHRAKHDAMCAGWFDSVTNAVSSAVHGVEHAGEAAYHGITHTWKKLKTPIQLAATAFGGPAAGALAGTVIDAANGDIGAKQAIAQVRANAAVNPAIAKKLTAATTAAAKATAAVHVADTVAMAAQGDPSAGSQVQELVQSAAQGDPGATTALELAQTLAQMGGLDPAQAAPATAQAAVSGIVSDLRHAAAHAVRTSPAQGPVIGYVRPHAGNPPQVRSFASVDDADDWFGQWLGLPDAFAYVAYYDRNDPSWPHPLNEQFGRTPPQDTQTVAGWLLPLVTGGAGFAAGYFSPELGRAAKHAYARARAALGKPAAMAPAAPPA